MFCPNCGADSPSANVYCKRCGEWLPDLKGSKVKWGGDTPDQHLKIMMYLNGLGTVAALASAILLYATYLGIPGGMTSSIALVAAFCLSMAAWQFSSFLIALKLRKRLERGRTADAGATRIPEATKSAPQLRAADTSEFVKSQSVTENTTAMLEPVPRVRARKE